MSLQHISVVKIGGNVIDSPEALASFLGRFAAIPGKKILVHGGGKEASRLCRCTGIEPVMVNGRRVTDADTLDVVTMVYAGLINKRIVSSLQALGCDALGLCGADGNAIRSVRRNPEPVNFGFVGDIHPDGVNSGLISALLDSGITPVFCAITHDAHGQLLNTNADSVATAHAVAMAKEAAVSLTFCFEMPGVLRDVADPSSLIPVIRTSEFNALCEKGIISGGMLPKLKGAVEAVEAGVEKVIITSHEHPHTPDAGTTICK